MFTRTTSILAKSIIKSTIRPKNLLSLTAATSNFNSSSIKTFATTTKRAVPQVWGFSGKEATKLFNAAAKTNSTQSLLEELKSFQTAFDSNYSLRVAFVNPLLKGEKRTQLLNSLFPKLKINNPLAKELIKYLAEHRQLPKLKKILGDYEKLVSHAKNEVHAIVISAEPLTTEQLTKLQTALKSRIDSSEKLVLTQKVDPSILGGLKIFLDNKLLDLTAASRIKAIDRALRGKA